LIDFHTAVTSVSCSTFVSDEIYTQIVYLYADTQYLLICCVKEVDIWEVENSKACQWCFVSEVGWNFTAGSWSFS